MQGRWPMGTASQDYRSKYLSPTEPVGATEMFNSQTNQTGLKYYSPGCHGDILKLILSTHASFKCP